VAEDGLPAPLLTGDVVPRDRWGDPALLYDEEKDLFLFTDARFALSCEHIDWALEKKGRLRGY
jgi:hypothetical protein